MEKELSKTELQFLVAAGNRALRKIESYAENLRKETAKLKAETEQKKAEIAELEETSRKHIKSLGWEGITPEEMKWVQENYHKEFQFFRPTLQSIRERIAQRNGETYTPPPMDPKFLGFEEYQCLNGWLDPDGRYYPVETFAYHDRWAWEYLEKTKGPFGAANLISKHHGATETLQDLGWVRIMKWDGVPINFVMPRSMTQSQKDSIFLFCGLNKLQLPFEKEF